MYDETRSATPAMHQKVARLGNPPTPEGIGGPRPPHGHGSRSGLSAFLHEAWNLKDH